MSAESKKSPWPMLVLAIAVFFLTVPMLSAVIPHLEPGREKPIDLQMLAYEGTSLPTEGTYVRSHCPEPCRLGTWLKIYVARLDREAHLAVWAESSSGKLLWYYPTGNGDMPLVTPTVESKVLSEAIKLSSDHASEKRWTLKMQLIKDKASREQIVAKQVDVIAAFESTLALGEGK